MTLLDNIKSPQDLKALRPEQLPELAAEIRQLIVQTVHNNGGHMASNLGVVELTIALHYIFSSPFDTILFDVSHQSYTHKILTGRAVDFTKIRTSAGYSGYFDKDESPHDSLTLGHAGCAPSIGLGMATAKKLRGEKGCVVTVIGDGGLTSGLAYEGLSNIVAANPTNLVVVLNDNGLAISQNVGWMASWRNRWLPHLRNQLEIDPDFKEFEQATQNLSRKIPAGGLFLDLAKGLKSAVQKAVIPGIGQFWEEMGFNYIGPVNGHDLPELLTYIQAGRVLSDKVPFIHVLTNKGQGWDPAAADPVHYHQRGPTSTEPKRATWSDSFAAALGDLMETDPRIMAISAAMLEGTSLAKIKDNFPERVIDVGICEEHAVSLAAGMARSGLRPVVCIYSTFLQRSLDQILHDVCMNDLPVTFALDRSGLVGQDGQTHHGLFDMAYMRLAPHMIVSAPSSTIEMAHLLKTALSQEHPFSIRFPKSPVPVDMPFEEPRILPPGTSEIICTGDEVCLIGVGSTYDMVWDAWKALRDEDINVGLVDLRYIKPIDKRMVRSLVGQYKYVAIIEEGTRYGGAGSALLEAMQQEVGHLPNIVHYSTEDQFPGHGTNAELRDRLGLTKEHIIRLVHQWEALK